jgi:hypothetical protein
VRMANEVMANTKQSPHIPVAITTNTCFGRFLEPKRGRTIRSPRP